MRASSAARMRASFTIPVVLILIASCSKDPASPGIEPPAVDPSGVFLAGDPNGDAIRVTIDMAPSPAMPEHILGDGLLSRRLTAVIRPAATAGEVNAALEAHGARIIAMRAGMAVVSLIIPPVASTSEAKSVASALVATDAFAFVFPAWEARATAPPERFGARFPGAFGRGARGGPMPLHLAAARVPAAWNAEDLAGDLNAKVVVLLPDVYGAFQPHPHIPAQRFVTPSGAVSPGANHGFGIAGILGATAADDLPYRGVHPRPALLEIRSIPVGGLSWVEQLLLVARHFPPAGRFVVGTSLGYEDPSFEKHPRIERALEGMVWRVLAAQAEGRFVQVSAAGDDGALPTEGAAARYHSPYGVHTGYPDLRVLVAEDAGAEALEAFERLIALYPEAGIPAGNALTAGSSAVAGEESAFSNAGSDIRVVGEEIPSPCVVGDGGGAPHGCDDGSALMSGSAAAVPQVAGLVAWLMNLDPDRSSAEVRTLLLHAYEYAEHPGIADAYVALLGLDRSLAAARVRLALLDVADDTGSPGRNGRFDHHDIRAFLEQWSDAARGVEHPGAARYDLNGDGVIGRAGATARFDLDVNSPPSFGRATQTIGFREMSFDESAVEDAEILCYYAWSSLYEGDPVERDLLLAEYCGGGVELRLTVDGWQEEIAWDGEHRFVLTATWWADGAPAAPAGGAPVLLTVTGGTIDVLEGETDAGGRFETSARIAFGAEALEVACSVTGGIVAADTLLVARRPVGTIGPPVANNSSLIVEANARVGSDACRDVYEFWSVPEDFSPIDRSADNDCLASQQGCGTITAASAGSLWLEIETVPETGALAAIRVRGSAAASLAGSAGECSGGGTAAVVAYAVIDFETAGVPVLATLKADVNPPSPGGQAYLVLDYGIFAERVGEAGSIDMVGALQPGIHRMRVDLRLSPEYDVSDEGAFTVEFRVHP